MSSTVQKAPKHNERQRPQSNYRGRWIAQSGNVPSPSHAYCCRIAGASNLSSVASIVCKLYEEEWSLLPGLASGAAHGLCSWMVIR